jgi:Protein of unknown function (DUF1488)
MTKRGRRFPPPWTVEKIPGGNYWAALPLVIKLFGRANTAGGTFKPVSFGANSAVPLTRMKDDYTMSDGVKFWMADEGRPVLCRVTHEALRDHADRVRLNVADDKVFEAYRELIEQVASDAYDAGANVDDAGCVLVTSEALDRVSRSA